MIATAVHETCKVDCAEVKVCGKLEANAVVECTECLEFNEHIAEQAFKKSAEVGVSNSVGIEVHKTGNAE